MTTTSILLTTIAVCLASLILALIVARALHISDTNDRIRRDIERLTDEPNDDI